MIASCPFGAMFQVTGTAAIQYSIVWLRGPSPENASA